MEITFWENGENGEDNGGMKSEFDAATAEEAVTGWLRQWGADEAITEVQAEDEGLTVTAYRVGASQWEIHVTDGMWSEERFYEISL